MSGTSELSFMVKNANLGKVYFVKISDLRIRNTLEYFVLYYFYRNNYFAYLLEDCSVVSISFINICINTSY